MNRLATFVRKSLAREVPPAIRDVADEIRKHHPDVVTVLAYGSCLRGVDPKDSLIDLYLLTGKGQALMPPTVYYAEANGHRVKYAMISLPQFHARMSASNPYFWARFAQPCACLFGDATLAIEAALRTAYAHAKAFDGSPLEQWTELFRQTYRTEFRPESENRPAEIVAANQDYYAEAARLLHDVPPMAANWTAKRIVGRTLSACRLIKTAFTFAGAADYVAWKIERHSGEVVTLSPWQRRHPIIAGILLLPKLLARGAVR